MELRRGDAVSLGFGISALVPRILLEEGHARSVTWIIEQGAVGGMALMDFQFGCASGAQAIMSSPDQFTYFHGGGFDRSLLSFLEIGPRRRRECVSAQGALPPTSPLAWEALGEDW